MNRQSLLIPVVSSVFFHVLLIAIVVFNADFKEKEKNTANFSVPAKFQSEKNNQPVKTVILDKSKVDELAKKIRRKKKADEAKRKKLEKKLARLEARQRAENKKIKKAIANRKKADKAAKLADKKLKLAKKKQLAEEKKRLLAEKKRIEQEQAADDAAEKNKQESLLLAQKRKEREIEEAKALVLVKKREQDELNRKRQQALETQMLEEQRVMAAEHKKFVITEVDKYKLWIRDKIYSNLIAGVDAIVNLRLAPGGLVVDVNCVQGDSVACRDALVAVKKSEPLPVSQDRDVFEQLRQIRLTLNKKDSGGN